ncbi:Epoxide hydrolase-like protein [Actinidia chinensis var. chinensis]|uniref:Epoxide hydrolase-like protein n=1 Tax=Actinidia chinensis var. chinensis TaxID=1590841 RepID=A0A2R6QZS9_ACTCC|nr:Epoxide hydrolase-like protein [Actinidia chinensis var. chinensis]
MAAGKGWFEKVRRCVRTIYFMVAMVASLLVLSAPLLVAIVDVLVPCVLISSFTCVRCHSFKDHLHKYSFKSSLTDIPLVSVIRSLIITCVYSMCDGPALSHGPYLGTVMLCSFSSILILSVKACVFSFNSQIEAEASHSLSRQKLHLKKSWGMPVLFLSSVVFALGHTVVAYRTSCRARRKLLFHRGDPEAVLSCKIVFSGFQKVPRSPTPSACRTPKSDSEMRRKPGEIARDEGEIPVRFLADIDSLFIACQGLTIHYKLSMSGSTPRSLSSTTIFDRPSLNVLSKTQYHLHRSFSNQFHTSSLYAPLLDGSATSPVLSEEIPVLSLDDPGVPDEASAMSSPTVEQQELEANGQIGIVLVHGFGGGAFSWRHVMGVLARQVGCTVAAFDRPGWGLTSRPRQKDWEENLLPNPYKLESQVDLLLSFCVEMGFSSVILVGHDDGGLLALKAAQRVHASPNSFNVEIKGVVLIGVSLSREVVPGFARILLYTSLGKKHIVRPLLRTEIIQVVNRRAWYDATKLTTEVLSLYKAPLCVEGWDEALHEIGKLSFETVLSPQNAAALLQAIEDLPVLVIAGAEDVLVPLKSSQVMTSKLVNSKLVAISGCGHLPHEECPKALLAAITPFISRLLAK